MEVQDEVIKMGRGDAQRITEELLAEHGLAGWRVEFNHARRTAGMCDYGQKLIVLSLPLMSKRHWGDTENTITHEIAHALTPHHRHDGIWARQHLAMGGDGLRCFQHFDEDAPYQATCERCGDKWTRYRAPMTGRTYRCRCRARVVFEMAAQPTLDDGPRKSPAEQLETYRAWLKENK